MARLLAAGLAFLLIGLLVWWAFRQAGLAWRGGERPARRLWRMAAAYLASAAALLALAMLLEWRWLAEVASIWSAPVAAAREASLSFVRDHVPRALTGLVSWALALTAIGLFALLHRSVLARTRGSPS
jgi:hypothetical protein